MADKYFCSIQDLPRDVLRTVLKSDKLVLLSARGNVVPGIQREVRVAAIIEQYLSRHPDQSLEQFLDCLKIWDMDTFVELAGAGITPQDSYSRRPPALRPVVRPPRPEHRAHHGAGPAHPRLRHSPGTVV